MTRAFTDVSLPEDIRRIESIILQTAYELLRKVGPGHRETLYRKFMVHGLRRRGLEVVQHRYYAMEFEGMRDDRAAQPDLIVNEKIVVELKSVDAIHPRHKAQLISYLRASGLPRGIILNFNADRFRESYDRFVHPDLLSGFSGSSDSPGSRPGHDAEDPPALRENPANPTG